MPAPFVVRGWQNNEPEQHTLYQNLYTYTALASAAVANKNCGVKVLGKIISNCSILNPPMTYNEERKKIASSQRKYG